MDQHVPPYATVGLTSGAQKYTLHSNVVKYLSKSFSYLSENIKIFG